MRETMKYLELKMFELIKNNENCFSSAKKKNENSDIKSKKNNYLVQQV